MLTEIEAREIYLEKKAKVDELVHAKKVSDEILAMFGMPKYGNASVSFPGLERARKEMDSALITWQETVREEKYA